MPPVITWHSLDAATLFSSSPDHPEWDSLPQLLAGLLSILQNSSCDGSFLGGGHICPPFARAYMSTRYLPRGSWEEGWERFSFECMFVRVNCSSSISSFQWREGKCQACVKWFVQSSSVAFSLLKLIVDFHSYNAHFTVWYQASMEMIFGVSEKRIFANVLGHKLAPE